MQRICFQKQCQRLRIGDVQMNSSSVSPSTQEGSESARARAVRKVVGVFVCRFVWIGGDIRDAGGVVQSRQKRLPLGSFSLDGAREIVKSRQNRGTQTEIRTQSLRTCAKQ